MSPDQPAPAAFGEARPAGAAMWVPCFIFAHLFAAFWICRALAKLAPERWRRLTAALPFCRGARSEAEPAVRAAGDLEAPGAAQPGPAAPLLLEWEGVGCAYSTPAGIRAVLQGVSGAARPGEVLALMGPSGAGKSTLLDILAGRKSIGRLAGRIAVNGAARGVGAAAAAAFARRVSYVPQEDAFLPTMTVEETCALHAALLLPRGTPARVAGERVEGVLAAMGLLHARDTLVGGVLPGGLCLRGLSGGERKRVSVAVGTLANPSIVFLDEPTSGLDSCSALSVTEHLRGRARASGLTVIASIHQPRAAVWACFDACSILSGGLLLFTGPRDDVVAWFESIGMGPWRPDVHGTSIDWVMDLVNVGFSSKQQADTGGTIGSRPELAAAAAAFAAYYSSCRPQLPTGPGAAGAPAKAAAAGQAAPPPDDRRSLSLDSRSRGHGGVAGSIMRAGSCTESSSWDLEVFSATASSEGGGGGKGAAAAHARAALDGCRSGGPRPLPGGGGDEKLGAGWRATFRALLWREFLRMVRNPADVAGRMLVFCWLGVLCGLVFWRAGDDASGAEGVRNRLNVLFIQAQQYLLMPYVYMSLYTADKRHYTADISARLYSPSPYYAAKSLAVLPFVVANVLVCALVSYGMVGLRLTPLGVAGNSASSILLYLIGQQVHSMASIMMPNEDTSFLVTILWSALCMYFSNFIIRFDDMWMAWLSNLRYISAVNFAYSAYIKAEFQGATLSCAGGLMGDAELAALRGMLPATPQLAGPAAARVLERPGAECVMRMDAVLGYFGVLDTLMWVYFAALIAYLGVVHLGTFLGLLLLARKERR